MSFVGGLVQGLGSMMWIVAILLVAICALMMLGMLFYKRYPIRVMVLQERGDKIPLMVMDRCGRVKDKDGTEWYKLFFAKQKIDVPDSKFLYPGRGLLNKQVLLLWEVNGRYLPVEADFTTGFHMKPIDTELERKRIALDIKIKAIHDTSSWLERNKGFVVTMAGVFIVLVIMIVLATQGKELKGMLGGIMGGLAPLMFYRWKK